MSLFFREIIETMGDRQGHIWGERFVRPRNRGEQKYTYTVSDIANLAGISVAAVKKAITRKSLVIKDLGSVLAWINSHKE